MKQILEAKLSSVRKALKDAYEECDQEGIIYHSGREELLEDLISQCNKAIYSFYQDNYYDSNEYYDSHFDEPWEVDEWSMHNNDMQLHKHEEISDMYNKHYHYSWWIGKNVIHTDSMWFTSDEVEAFRVIWQRRISAM
jgi:hypothetical protein